MNAGYKNLTVNTFFLEKLYNEYHNKFRFESKKIVDCFKSQYVETVVPKKSSSSELNGLELILPKLEQDNVIEVPKTSYTYINR